MLLYYEGRIMVIVKAQGNFALAMLVFPKHGNNVVSREINIPLFKLVGGLCTKTILICQTWLLVVSSKVLM